ncbi:ATP-binding protein [Mycobacteroides abscessus]|nr:ATP-binding protein [Mycobacteroides abscessus]RIS03545.1 ATP-binding protein [Mycobacteroides abscessus]
MRTSGSRQAESPENRGRTRELVVAANFIQAVRDSGYVSLSTALAELVDNSLQAQARTISITIDRAHHGAAPEIKVCDDGAGMDRTQLEACLQFGGTARFNDRQSFGRFGMGLPAASLSQSREIEVVTWQNGRHPISVGLDVDAIAAGTAPRFAATRRRLEVASPNGCQVTWRRCDRIEYQRLAWLERALHRDLGRMYRRFLVQGVLITINGIRVKATDPLHLSTVLEGRHASLAFEPLRYELAASDGGTSFVEVRFSVLPVDAWHHLDNPAKRRAGIVAGGGVSILRAGREIAFGWHLLGGKRKENYDDWWRCEIEFDPTLDEHFGITINKQGIRPSAQLREAIESEIESAARTLNARVRQAFEDVKFREATQESCRIAEAADRNLPVLRCGGRRGQVGALSYRLTSGPLSSGEMFEAHVEGGALCVTLNTDHPAFAALYGPLQALAGESGSSSLRTAVELLVLSFVRSSFTIPPGPRDVVAAWSDAYAKMLQQT